MWNNIVYLDIAPNRTGPLLLTDLQNIKDTLPIISTVLDNAPVFILSVYHHGQYNLGLELFLLSILH